VRRVRRPILGLIGGLVLLALAARAAPAQLSIAFDRYHTFAEMTAFLREAAARYPELATLSSIGKSYQGRDLWLLTVTNRKTGAPEAKPAIYINGCLDSSEVVTTEGVLYTIKALLEGYGRDARITRLLDRRTFYLVPRIMPDLTELYLTTPQNARSVSAEPVDDDGDGQADEDPDDDVDGDGHVVQMRVKDPHGEWKVSDRDPRLMVRRRPGEAGGVFYRLLSEGRDDDGDGRYNEDRVGGIDPNRNYPGNWAPVHTQAGAGPYPLYVQEVRAEVEFLERHRNIAAYLNHHSSGGVVLRPSTTHDDSTIPAEDLRLLRVLAAQALDETGYWLATSVFDWRWPPGTPDTKPGQTWRRPDGSLANDPRVAAGPGLGAASWFLTPQRFAARWRGVAREAAATIGVGPASERAAELSTADGDDHAYPAYGGSIEYTYELLGIVSYASEQWRAAYDFDLDKDGTISELERLAWNDQAFGGRLFIDWKPFAHPQLGEVEIGGWKKYTTSSPPPGKYLEEESARQFRFNVMLAEMLPELAVESLEAKALGGGVFRVSAKVRNTGVIPTATQMMEKVRRHALVIATLTANGDLELLDGQARVSLGTLPGAPAEGKTANWLVRLKGAGPIEVTVTASAPTAGTASRRVTLK
jgi:murein tripeptide amidase MpaA